MIENLSAQTMAQVWRRFDASWERRVVNSATRTFRKGDSLGGKQECLELRRTSGDVSSDGKAGIAQSILCPNENSQRNGTKNHRAAPSLWNPRDPREGSFRIDFMTNRSVRVKINLQQELKLQTDVSGLLNKIASSSIIGSG